MTTTLKLAKDLTLPLETVTQTIAVLAKRRAGKSYTMRRLVEQLLKAQQQVVLVDPKGDQWGVRYAADGKAPGLPMVILGGERGDVPLEATSGEVVAKLVVEERVSALLDLSLFRKHEVATFMTAFLEHLYRLKAREIYRTPVMLVIDEADAVAPQKPQKGEERMLGAAEDIVRRGGQRGIGCVLVTQRSAVLNKNVLTQAQVLIVLRTIAPQDLLAIKAWVDVHGTDEEGADLMDSLPSLPIGDAWFWSPGWPTVDGIFKRVHVLPIETFDSGKSPEPGVKPVDPTAAAAVDLEALTRQMAATIEKAKADDPRELRKQIADLRRQLSSTAITSASERLATSTPVLTDTDRVHIDQLARAISDTAMVLHQELELASQRLRVTLEQTAGTYVDKVLAVTAKAEAALRAELMRPRIGQILDKLSQITPPTTTATTHPRSPLAGRVAPALAQATSRRPARQVSHGSGDTSLGRAERALLIAAVQRLPKSVSRAQLSVLSGYSIKSSSFSNALGALRSKGLVVGVGDDNRATDAGVVAAGECEPLPTGRALVEHWMGQLGKAERALLEVFVQRYPSEVSKADLSASSGYSETSSSFSNALGKLRTLELVNGLRASEELFS